MSSGPNVRDLDECRDIHQGTVFIVASGASAKDFHPEEFAHVPMITMNGAISKFVGTGIKPFFYACTDRDFSAQQPELFSQAMLLSERVALWEDHLKLTSVVPKGEVFFLSKAPKLSWAELVGLDDELVRNRNFLCRRNRRIGFSKNLKRGFFDARTVAYLALQIAYHAGFTKAVMVGVDLNQSVQRFYDGACKKKSPCGLDQHFHTRILPSFEIVSEKVICDRFQVYNLSKASRIPAAVIPQVSLSELDQLIRA
jgi:KDO transferase-3